MNTQAPGANGPSFRNLGIAPNLLTVLDKIAYTTPTPIQEQAILPAINGKDIVGIAQTGTGKTLAFSIPLVQNLLIENVANDGVANNDTVKEGTAKNGVAKDSIALVVVPTRELALQVEETVSKIGLPLGVRSAVLIGGAPMRPQISALRRFPKIIIATPGRLMDHMEQKNLSLSKVKFLVLDEADRMLDMGFLPAIKKILLSVPEDRQTMLFSATLSGEILNIATKAMKLPLQIEIAPQGTTAKNITQEIFIVNRDDKLRLLEKILADHKGSVIIFTRTKHGATKVAYKVMHFGHTATEIHSNRSQGQRKTALEGFKNGRFRVLVATDIVARGIDVKNVELVINFDLPSQSEDYVHRIGRTARAGASGHAISFALPNERRDIKDIERLIRKPIKLSPLPIAPSVTNTQNPVSQNSSGGYQGHKPRFAKSDFSKPSSGYRGSKPKNGQKSFNSKYPSRGVSRFSRGDRGRAK